jgi:glycosyltransferase involved in cell wall biosynthesis
MRVLLISHTCQSRTEGQPKAHALAAIPGVHLRVIVPEIWKHYGKWRRAEPAGPAGFELAAERVRWPWVGPAQNYLHWYPDLRQILREFKPDLIDLWEEPWGAVSAHACWLRDKVLPTAKIVSETEQNLDKRLPPPFEQFRRYVLRRADFVVGRNAESVGIVRRKGYRGPTAVVPNAVDTRLFKPMDRQACRNALGLEGFVVGYVGRLVEEKGILDLIDAVAKCPSGVNLLIVGDGPLTSEVRRRAALPHIRGRVRLLPAKPLSELPPIFNALDVLVLPSLTTRRWKEQFGRVIIEAHACGVPVIGSDSGAIPDVIGAGGLLVREGSPPDLQNAIDQLFKNPDMAKSYGETGLRQVHAYSTWERVAERMYGIYSEALGHGRTYNQAVPAVMHMK